MSSAKKSKSLGKLPGREGITGRMKRDSQLDAGVHTRVSGPDGRAVGPDGRPAGDRAVEAPEDLYPHRMDFTRPEVDEALRDELSLIAGGVYGEDKIGGVRQQNGRFKTLLGRPFHT